MHVIALKRQLVEKHPELPRAIYAAFLKAQDIARSKLFDSAALSTMLPWQLESPLAAEDLLDRDCSPPALHE